MVEKNRVIVVGAGMMGPGIAARAALAGRAVTLLDISAERAEAGVVRALAAVAQLAGNGLATRSAAGCAATLIGPGTHLDQHLADTFMIVEAVNENLALKQSLFEAYDRSAPPDVIITSNTSGLRITDIAARTTHPERTVTTHFWLPAHLIPLVEVVLGDRSAEATGHQVCAELLRWGKAPVLVRRDQPGQLAGRMMQALIREATSIVGSGLASAEDVDTALKQGLGLRLPAWGILEHIDTVGLDLVISAQQSVLPALDNDPAPAEMLQELVAHGHLGHKTGSGFYDWSNRDQAALIVRRDQFIMQALRILNSSQPDI